MCGFAAVVGQASENSFVVVERMVKALSHRGPDATGLQLFPGCYLGHARLSIIDLTNGAQPMVDVTGRYAISFNGEIYNYRELRNDLIKSGHTFSTNSDTEVVLAAYSEWGAECLDRFRGMFAFVIWDVTDRKLFGARDLFGEKPFYYSTLSDGSMAAASEIGALIQSGLFEPLLDRDSVDAYLTLGYVPPDRTIYSNVQTLPPGHYLDWKDGTVRVNRYWRPQFNTQNISLDDAAERLRELLKQAVGRQMVADVPVGAFLSGGLDSSTVVAMMQQHSTQPVRTFSVGFGEMINELPYARAVAKKYNTRHYDIDLGVPPVATMLERMATVYDEPFADSSHIPTYLISEFARKHVKVVLTGDGGDELFGGYSWYPPLAMSENMSTSQLKWMAFRALSKLVGHRVRSLYLYSGALGLAARWPDTWTQNVMSNICFGVPERRQLWGERQKSVTSFAPPAYFRPPPGTSGLNEGFAFDLASYLPGDILVKVDRASMAHGLETRAPFLDRDLVEFALSLPASLKVTGSQMKLVLKQACSRYWPPELRNRSKQGFGAPYKDWLGFDDVRALTSRVLLKDSRLRSLLPGLQPAEAPKRNYQAWVLLTLGLWLEVNKVEL